MIRYEEGQQIFNKWYYKQKTVTHVCWITDTASNKFYYDILICYNLF